MLLRRFGGLSHGGDQEEQGREAHGGRGGEQRRASPSKPRIHRPLRRPDMSMATCKIAPRRGCIRDRKASSARTRRPRSVPRCSACTVDPQSRRRCLRRRHGRSSCRGCNSPSRMSLARIDIPSRPRSPTRSRKCRDRANPYNRSRRFGTPRLAFQRDNGRRRARHTHRHRRCLPGRRPRRRSAPRPCSLDRSRRRLRRRCCHLR